MAMDAAEPRPMAAVQAPATIAAAVKDALGAGPAGARLVGADLALAHRAEHVQRADPAAALGLSSAVAVGAGSFGSRACSISLAPALAPRAAAPVARERRAGSAPRAVRIGLLAHRLRCWSIRLLALAVTGKAAPIKWIDNFGIQILIYVMLGWGLNIVVGLAGLLDLGYVAFYAVGAYSYALLAHSNFGLSFWICLPLAGICWPRFWGILLGFPVLRLRGDYLAIVTLAFGEIIRLVLINWVTVHQRLCRHHRHSAADLLRHAVQRQRRRLCRRLRPRVLADLPHDLPLSTSSSRSRSLTAFVTLRLRRLPVGRAWEALREDEIACRSLGINTTNTKLTAFAIGAMFGGFAGSFFAARQGFISPGVLHLHGIGDDPRHRRARRHGQPDRRRDRRRRHDRRHRDPARARFPQARCSAPTSTRRSTAC